MCDLGDEQRNAVRRRRGAEEGWAVVSAGEVAAKSDSEKINKRCSSVGDGDVLVRDCSGPGGVDCIGEEM